MELVILSFILAYFFAFNIGASGSAAAMSVSYGAGAIPQKKWALIICSIALMLGAVLGSGPVVKTLSHSIIPSHFLTPEIVVIILAASAGTLFISNLLSIPLSTSEVTVGAIVGAGIAFQSLNINKLLIIFSFWIVVPIVAMVATYLLVKGGDRFYSGKRHFNAKWKKIGSIILILTGCLEAYAAGMNNVGNAIGPLVGAGLVPVHIGILTGAVFMVIGVLSLGSRVIETSAKRIVKLSIPNGIAVSGVSGILVTLASVYGLPIPITQVTTSAIAGVSASKNRQAVWKQPIIKLIIKVWLVSPALSMIVAYLLIQACVRFNFYSVIIILCVILATLCTSSLLKTKHIKELFNEKKPEQTSVTVITHKKEEVL
ncbi:inorganic phosphate transporter [Terrilactibacillus sp. BCM23-1]|uniref:Phosphate transporter n=1 Tax=Terrilactibacillus tamarindi TaxID=2599694 RepID=A0A6N8CM61_9BACI|nr:inorganic phosphate transporter [Terrilactibacillus tamarindi]MTT30961.1 inorganic phosphate transporter [Terrilactibacillus tamarindi]